MHSDDAVRKVGEKIVDYCNNKYNGSFELRKITILSSPRQNTDLCAFYGCMNALWIICSFHNYGDFPHLKCTEKDVIRLRNFLDNIRATHKEPNTDLNEGSSVSNNPPQNEEDQSTMSDHPPISDSSSPSNPICSDRHHRDLLGDRFSELPGSGGRNLILEAEGVAMRRNLNRPLSTWKKAGISISTNESKNINSAATICAERQGGKSMHHQRSKRLNGDDDSSSDTEHGSSSEEMEISFLETSDVSNSSTKGAAR